jgi:hypothetical protein
MQFLPETVMITYHEAESGTDVTLSLLQYLPNLQCYGVNMQDYDESHRISSCC